MYTRPYRQRRTVQSDIQVPDNYNGSAFAEPVVFPEEPAEASNFESPHTSAVFEPVPDDDILPQRPAPSAQAYTANSGDEKTAPRKESGLSSLLPPALARNFPFGHGIGTEELIILGAMLVLMRSPEGTEGAGSDMLLILALILLSG